MTKPNNQVFLSTTCGTERNCKKKSLAKATSWLPAFALAILPKCPFCIMAYSGAMSMCSGNMLYPNANSSTSYILLGLATITLLGILLNKKGKRTWQAAAITLSGILLLSISQFYSMSETLYYLSVLFIFFGIWFNGSFYFFYKKLTSSMMIRVEE